MYRKSDITPYAFFANADSVATYKAQKTNHCGGERSDHAADSTKERHDAHSLAPADGITFHVTMCCPI